MKLLTLFILAQSALAIELPPGSITNVTSSLPLTKEEAPIRDYVLDLGRKHGIHPNDTLTVKRVIPVMAPAGGISEFLIVPIGELAIFFLGEETTIARPVKLPNPKELPWLEYYDFQVGDRIEIKRDLQQTDQPS